MVACADAWFVTIASEPGARRCISISGGRSDDGSAIAILDDHLELRLPDFASQPPAVQQRCYAAALFALQRLAYETAGAEEVAALVERGSEYLRTPGGGSVRPRDAVTPIWDDSTPAEVVHTTIPKGLPVAIEVTTRGAQTALELLHAASACLPLRLTSVVRDPMTVRRPINLKNGSGQVLPLVRYANAIGNEVGVHTGHSAMGWFWEVQGRTVKGSDETDPVTIVLTLTGLAQTDGVIAYGAELLTFWRAAIWYATGRDPATRVRALWLAPAPIPEGDGTF
jgi:hypothetical protein